MEKNIFVTSLTTPPERWQEAFPQAEIVSQVPDKLEEGTIIWLHETVPDQPPDDGVRFVVMYNEPGEDKGLAALAQGASGYCNTYSAPELLHTIELAIRTNDGLWVGEELLNRLLTGLNVRIPTPATPEHDPRLADFSERERAIALCVAKGESNKEIMLELGIAERTIKSYLTKIFKKLGVRDRLQLAILLNSPAA